MALPYTLDQHKECVKKVHGNNIQVLSTSYTLRNSVLRYKFTSCGHEFDRRADYVVQGSGKRCLKCIKLRNSSKIKQVSNKYKWSTCKYKEEIKTKFSNITCVEDYVNWNTKIKHRCKSHGIFYASPAIALQKAVKNLCNKCGILKRNQKITKTQKTVINQIFNKHGTKVLLNESYKGTIVKHKFICDKGHIWETTVDSVIRISGCPKCCRSPSFSKLERLWIKKMRKINPNILTSDDKYIKIQIGKRFLIPDGYDPTTKTVYEFHGDYWHGNLNKYKKRQYQIGMLCTEDLNRKTRKREKALLLAGYKVVYCWESDFKKYLTGKFVFRKIPCTKAVLSKSPYCY